MATIILQLLLGTLAGFGAMMLVHVPEGWELVVGAAGITAGVMLAAFACKRRPSLMHAAAASGGAFAGALLIPLLPPLGYQALCIPLFMSTGSYAAINVIAALAASRNPRRNG